MELFLRPFRKILDFLDGFQIVIFFIGLFSSMVGLLWLGFSLDTLLKNRIEIRDHYYWTIDNKCKELPILKPFIKEKLKDGIITEGEYTEIELQIEKLEKEENIRNLKQTLESAN